MKKLLVYFSIVTLAFGSAACGGNAKDANGSQSTGKNTESLGGTENGSLEENTEGGGHQGDYSDGWSEEMEELKAAAAGALGDDYWPDMALLPDMLEMNFGITSDMYEDYMAEMPMIGTNVDTLVIVRAKDGKADAVWEALNSYREAKIGDTLQYPMNVGKIQASRIERIGNYVILAQLGADVTDALESSDADVIAKCQEANDLAIGAISQKLEQ